MLDPQSPGDEPLAPIPPIPESIVFTDAVVIDFHAGPDDAVHWATLHVGHRAIEIGTVRGPGDLDSVLTMTAGVLVERSTWADDVYVSPDGTQRWVLIGSWLLNARMSATPNHVHFGTPELAREMFRRLSEAQL